jgi:hypothetical protein
VIALPHHISPSPYPAALFINYFSSIIRWIILIIILQIVDVETETDIKCANKQVDEVGSFARFVALKSLDLSNNRIQLKRQLDGILEAPALVSLNLVLIPPAFFISLFFNNILNSFHVTY